MPELPDIEAYARALRARLPGKTLDRVRVSGPFVLRTVEPPLSAVEGRRVIGVRRLGKRLVLELEDQFYLVIHLMIAGRLHWRAAGVSLAPKRDLAAMEFAHGTLVVTEAGSQRRVSLHLLCGEEALSAMDPGGIDPLSADLEGFAAALRRENHTLKRALTDQRLVSGIGNAYSDEILHRARLSPVKLTQKLDEGEMERLHQAVREVLGGWRERLIAEAEQKFPERVTAFRPEMAVHGKYGQPCPVCGDPIQRIRYEENECNYCATCQTGGRLLADRALSRLLKADWPRTLREMEERRREDG